MKNQTISRDLFAGLTLVVFGGCVVALASRRTIGTLSHMEAGFLPVVLGIMLAGLGVIIATRGILGSGDAEAAAYRAPDIRGCVAIVSSVVVFVLLGQWLGLVAATFVSALIAASGDRQMTVRGALGLATALVALAVVLFSYLLKIPFPLVRW